MIYPVTLELDYGERRSRLTTFFRGLLALPHIIVLAVWGLAVYVVLVIAWFALLFTGRWPLGMYNFTAGFLRYLGRVSAYMYLGVDRYPAFNGDDDPSYPARVAIGPPLESYSRVKVFFRPIYAIGAIVIRYAMGIVLSFVTLASWFVIVVTGRQPAALQNAIFFALQYTLRSDALLFLLTETYPPFGDETPAAHPATVG